MSLRLALPSKGRMKADVLALFERAGLTVEGADQRAYQGTIAALPDVDVLFVSNSEIARDLGTGAVHAGVTGEDLVREGVREAERTVAFLVPLGLGRADVVVAVPEAWIDVDAMADLDDVAANYRRAYGRRLRVATKYWRLTQDHFRDHFLHAYRIVESLGATEGAPASGAADIIVDITSTGSTLRANRLKVLDDGVILRSQAQLMASRRAVWSDRETDALTKIAEALAGVV